MATATAIRASPAILIAIHSHAVIGVGVFGSSSPAVRMSPATPVKAIKRWRAITLTLCICFIVVIVLDESFAFHRLHASTDNVDGIT